MNLHEHIKKVLRETVNESTFFRRRVDMRLVEKEFYENLNYATDGLISKLKKGIRFDFDVFKRIVMHNLMDDYHNDLSDGGLNDFPYDEVYEFLLNLFHDKIKDRYDLILRRNINESKTLQENEEDPTQKILSFLRRRYDVEEHNFGDKEHPITIKMLRIKNASGQFYSIRSTGSKKEQIRDILDTLMILNVIDDFDFGKTKDNPYAQKAVRAVKMFYDGVMGDKSNIKESKILDKIKSFLGNKPLTKDDKLINAIAEFINENYSIDFELVDYEMTFYLTNDTGNWIFPPIMEYYPKYKKLHYSWKFAEDIHTWIGDDRLLQPDSEMMGKIFEKLFDKKVVEVYGYSRL